MFDRLELKNQLQLKEGIYYKETAIGKMGLYSVQGDMENIKEVLKKLNRHPAVEYAEMNLRCKVIEYEKFKRAENKSILSLDTIDNMLISKTTTPDDPLYSEQWGIESVNVLEAWQDIIGIDNKVTVAVLDTGVEGTREDLVGRIATGKNFAQYDSNGDPYPEDMQGNIDDNGHGTMVAGVIAAVYDNGIGIAGTVGPGNVEILPLKVLNDMGWGTFYDVA